MHMEIKQDQGVRSATAGFESRPLPLGHFFSLLVDLVVDPPSGREEERAIPPSLLATHTS
jgi:hypothetical protein